MFGGERRGNPKMTHPMVNSSRYRRPVHDFLCVAASAAILFAAFAGSAEAAGRGGGGGRGGASHGGGGYRGGGYRGGGWGGGYYPGPAIVYGNPYYCTPPLIWTVFGAGGMCY